MKKHKLILIIRTKPDATQEFLVTNDIDTTLEFIDKSEEQHSITDIEFYDFKS